MEAIKTLNIKRMPTRSPTTRIEWDVTVDVETTIGDLLNPVFWSHAAGSTFNGQNNLITVYWEDKSQIAELYVQHYDHAGAKMRLLSHIVFDDVKVTEVTSGYEAKWIDASRKFGVTRLSDQTLIKDGIKSKAEALAFIEEYKSKAD